MATTINSGYANSPKLTANIADHANVHGGRALVFDGVSDYMQPNSSIDLGENPTISLWIKPESGSRTLMNFGGNKYIFLYSDGRITWNHSNNIGAGTRFDTTNTKFTMNAWNHLVFVKDGTSGYIYINGQQGVDTYTWASGLSWSGQVFIGSQNATQYFYDGSMADLKFFNSALTETQVQELYKKPENTPIAVQDNLVAWYPMIEGNPESPQSIVYDHSEKKLSSELVNDSSFELSGEQSAGTNGTYYNLDSEVSISNGQLISNATSSTTTSIVGGISVIQGKTYKIEIVVASGSSNANISITNGNNSVATGYITYSEGSNIVYYTPSTTTTLTAFKGANGSRVWTIDSFSVKEVLMGNHATTNFFGDELWDNDYSSGTGGWTAYGSNTIANDSGAVKITYADDERGGFNYLRASGDTSFNLTVGKTYKVTANIKVNTGTVNFTSSGGSTTSATITETSFTSKSITFVCTHATDNALKFSGMETGEIVFIDDISLKEVGISSSGFETAVNEPVIPQVPLMKYNQKMKFKSYSSGTTGQYVEVDINSFNLGDFTISFWYNTNNPSGTFIGRSTNSTIRFNAGTNTVRIGQNNYYISASAEIVNGRFLTATREGTSFKLYVDGILDSTTTVVTDAWTFGGTGARIGQSAWGNFDGTIHECSVFNTALTQSQIQELFNDGVALDATTHSKASALRAYWRNDGVTTWKNRGDNFASFDGVDDIITRNAINVDYKSFSVWVRPNTTITKSSGGEPIGSFLLGGFSVIWIGAFSSGDTDELITIYNGNRTTWENAGDASFPNDSWTHLAFVWDGSKYQIYYNGQPQTTTTNATHVTLQNNNSIFIGRGGANRTEFFDGDIANVALWSESLTDAQMLSVYNSGHNGDISSIQSSDLELYYTFNPHALTDADTNASVQDRSGNDNDSTSVSGAVINRDGDVQGSPDSITIREGLNSNRDGLGFYFTNPSSNVLRLGRIHGEYLDAGSSKSLDNIWHGGGTVELWVKPEGETGNMGIMHKAGNGNQGWTLKTDTYSNGWHLRFDAIFSGTNYTFQKNSYLKKDIWTYIAVTYSSNAGEQATIYTSNESGVLSAITSPNTNTTSTGTYTSDAGQDLIIGSKESNSTKFSGLMDEIRIYNRALSLDEITKNFKHQKGKHKND